MLEIYENIKKYRKMNKWTQEELAKKVGYGDRSTISRIERGEIDQLESLPDQTAPLPIWTSSAQRSRD